MLSGVVMASRTVYDIKITNWEKHNTHAKKTHKKIMISTSFLMDSKVRQLTPTGKLLFLTLLLIAGESASSQIEVSNDSLCFQSGVRPGSLQSQLTQLESLQLVTYRKKGSNELKETELIVTEASPFPIIENPKENFPKYFESFVIQKMQSSDHGLIRGYYAKAQKAFVTIAGFDEFANQVMSTKKFNELDLDGQRSYFKKAFIEELGRRGCL